MSWFAKNYEKAAIGGAAVVALGLAYAGWSKIGAVETDFSATTKGVGKNDPAVAGADLIPKAIASMGLDRTVKQAMADDRAVDTFTGIPLFVSRDNSTEGLDLIDGEKVHDEIPNTWWLEHKIDLGFADSPERDEDEDGFSNLEEFKGNTNPSDSKSHPSLIAKLKLVEVEEFKWFIRPGFEAGGGAYTFSYGDSLGKTNKVKGATPVAPGGMFFESEPMKDRFKFLGIEVRNELNERLNEKMDVTYHRIEDQRPNKKGTIYEIPNFPEQDAPRHAKTDFTAVFSLEALGLAGQDFKVEENTPFALPQDAKEKNYLLKSVTPEKVEVEYTAPDGTKQTVEIPKGSMPKIAP
jgi:hypothetical protein